MIDQCKSIIQIGSHIGNSVNDPIFSKVSKDSKLILVEPVPFIFKKLKKNYNKFFPNNNFVFINKAVSNKIGEITLTIPSERNDFSKQPFWASQLASVNSSHIFKHIPSLLTDEIVVPCTTLNQIIDEYNITELDLLHTDTEGHDYDILMDFNFKIKPKIIQFEHKHMDGIFKVGDKHRKFLEYFKSKGYIVHGTTKEDTILKFC